MKTVLSLICAALLLSPIIMAGEKSCPAHRAAEHGHSPFEAFHAVMAPAWHHAWPDKDYDALLEAGPEFEKTFAAIAGMKPKFKSKEHETSFLKARAGFAKLVEEYAKAAEAGDKTKVYELMPGLHEAFEMTAASLLPIEYKELEGVVITSNMIVETHIPKNNLKGIIGSTETLVTKLERLNEETLPAELKEHKKAVLVDIATLKSIAAKMKECCENKDMDAYKEQAAAFDTKLQAFIDEYI